MKDLRENKSEWSNKKTTQHLKCKTAERIQSVASTELC